jgi:formylglycine-generating enzyme required for sulfatase activity
MNTALYSWKRKYLVASPLLVVIMAALVWSAVWGLRTWDRHGILSARYPQPPEGMVFVPPGEFLVGSDISEADQNERPQRRVFARAFYIDIHEVTNAEFKQFDPSHIYDEGQSDWPVVKVDKATAQAYAAWAGKRLPTSIEWEKAARGTDGRLYPWGDVFDRKNANLGGYASLMPVGSFPSGVSPYGALDMAGNAWEWVDDLYRDKGWPGAKSIERGIIRGGAYAYSPHHGRTSYIGFESENLTCGDLGFRCAKDAEPF